MIGPKEQLEILKRGTVEIISEAELLAFLQLGTPLRIKMGVDPTAPDVHLGHTVVMRKLRAFQELGHQVVLIVGDYTATVGDPSGKNKTRPRLTHEEVLENSKTYQEQFFKIVDREKTEIHYNGSWFGKMPFSEVTRLMSQITVAQMLEREDFANRYVSGQPISLHEFLYPMMQGYDSVAIRSHVELGGTDQKFNILRGRELQKQEGLPPQVGVMLPILIGTDGREKMSKSLGNLIGVNDTAQTMVHKLINIPDDLIESYFTLLTNRPLIDTVGLTQKIKDGAQNPIELKHELAVNIATQYHSANDAQEALAQEKKIHAGEALPENIPVIDVLAGEVWPAPLMVQLGWVKSNGEARRFVQNGGVSWDDQKLTDPNGKVMASGEHLLKLGKRNFAKVVVIK